MLGFSEVSGLWVRCNGITIWASFWHVLRFIRQITENDEDWKRMFTGQMSRLLPLHESLSGPQQTVPILRTSGDATMNRIGAINWRTREFFVENPDDLIEPFLGLRPK